MQQADLEREKKRANEELVGLLTELVIEPVDSRFESRTREALFAFEERLEDKLKKQFSAVSKTRDLESKFTELEDGLEHFSSKLRIGIEGFSHDLERQSAAVQASILERQSELWQRLEHLDAVCQDVGQISEQSFVRMSGQLAQHAEWLRSQLASNEQAQVDRVNRLHVELKEISELSVTGSQHMSSVSALLSKDISALLEQSSKCAVDLQTMQKSMEQQQLLIAAQQLEIQRLQDSWRRVSWPGLILGVMILGAVAFIALQTPIVAAFVATATSSSL
ncbi:hypothetical protein D9M68_520630 [compost metagenome]